MNLKTLVNKTKDSIKLIMAQPTMIFRNKEAVTLIEREHIVDKDECARPDLIALQYYGNQSKLDMILKWNGISDPFSINEGDELEIPSPGTNFFKLDRPKEFENNPVKQQFVDNKRLSKKDQRRRDALKKKYGKKDLLPPNVIPVGKKNYEFDGSRIKMGAQVQTDDVVDAINRDLEQADSTLDPDKEPISIGGENTGKDFEKIPGGVWSWTGSRWIGVNPDVVQEVAGSIRDNYGNPNGNVEGTFEGQLYFDIIEEDTEDTPTESASRRGADNVGDNQSDGGNPAGGNNTNTGAADGPNNTSNCD